MGRKRILFFAEGATMAHFVRPLALAQSLDPAVYDVHFYSPPRFRKYLPNQTFAIGDLDSMPGDQFLANLAKGAPLFSYETLRRYADSDIRLIERLQPDLIIGDMRLSLPVSAAKTGVKYAAMINAYWSPYAKYRAILPEVPITRLIPPRLIQPFYRFTEPLAYAIHVGPLNRVRKEFGIAALPPDVRAMYTDGDFILYADIPEFVPTDNLPENHFYVGTCPWTPEIGRPFWWEKMAADERPKVFVSLGSSGATKVFPALRKALVNLPIAAIVSTSGRQLPQVDTVDYWAELLPFEETAALAGAVVSHGGSGGLYPAMTAGTPVLGVPSNADQHLSTDVLQENGAGLGVRVEEASAARLQHALERLLFEPDFRNSARRWAAIYAKYDSGAMFQSFLKKVF